MAIVSRFRVQCGHCMTTSSVEPRAGYGRTRAGELTARYELCECPNCLQPVLLSMAEVGEEDGVVEYSVPAMLYPARAAADPAWPKKVSQRYTEAETCLRSGTFNAAAVMCRRTMEQVCLELGVNEKTLVKSLEKLRQLGAMDDRLLQWANSLRAVGNVGAHAGSEDVSREDASDVLEFARALIDYVFTFHQRFKAFKDRRASTTPAPAAAE